jgi:hypothetical protein
MIELSCSVVELIKVKIWNSLLVHREYSDVVLCQSDEGTWLVALELMTTDIDELLVWII